MQSLAMPKPHALETRKDASRLLRLGCAAWAEAQQTTQFYVPACGRRTNATATLEPSAKLRLVRLMLTKIKVFNESSSPDAKPTDGGLLAKRLT